MSNRSPQLGIRAGCKPDRYSSPKGFRDLLRRTLISAIVLWAASAALAQTFEINGQSSTTSTTPNAKRGKKSQSPGGTGTAPRSDTGMGWGSSIEVARQARAAQEALDKGNYSAAMDYATRATKAAPQNPDFWFLLAYAAAATILRRPLAGAP